MIETKLSIKNLGIQTKIDQIDIEKYLDAYNFPYTKRNSRDEQKTITYYIKGNLLPYQDLFLRLISYKNIEYTGKEDESSGEESLDNSENSEKETPTPRVHVPTSRLSITLPTSLVERLYDYDASPSKTIEAALEAYLT